MAEQQHSSSDAKHKNPLHCYRTIASLTTITSSGRWQSELNYRLPATNVWSHARSHNLKPISRSKLSTKPGGLSLLTYTSTAIVSHWKMLLKWQVMIRKLQNTPSENFVTNGGSHNFPWWSIKKPVLSSWPDESMQISYSVVFIIKLFSMR